MAQGGSELELLEDEPLLLVPPEALVSPLEPPAPDSEELLLDPPSLLEPPRLELPPTLELPPLLDELLLPSELPPLAEELPPWLLLAPPLPARLELADDCPPDDDSPELEVREHPAATTQLRIKAKQGSFRMGTSKAASEV